MTRNLPQTFIKWTAMALTWSISSFHSSCYFLLCVHLTDFWKCVLLKFWILSCSDETASWTFPKYTAGFTEAYPVLQHFFYSISSKNFYSIGRVVVLITFRNYSIVNFCSQSEFLYPATTEILCHTPRNNYARM